ncbi:hypothetical protein F5876DRAFT_68507 [Lentinula aff. lateritia]|uniref:Uncharacterized protein n=1 Tax=Lentinula aff. lateritia TaxID=2804960 RepID=A0ACC1TQS3_9AGAR|nr:hypothetical protein F5876DRAFT_68507 [Lentinula aff. lateritia]
MDWSSGRWTQSFVQFYVGLKIGEHPAYTTTPQKYIQDSEFDLAGFGSHAREDGHLGPFNELIHDMGQGSVILRSGGGYDNQRHKVNGVLFSVPVNAQKILLENSREVQGRFIRRYPFISQLSTTQGIYNIPFSQVQHEMEDVEGRLWKERIIAHVLVGEDFSVTLQDNEIEGAPCTTTSISTSKNISKSARLSSLSALRYWRILVLTDFLSLMKFVKAPRRNVAMFWEDVRFMRKPTLRYKEANTDLEINDCCWGLEPGVWVDDLSKCMPAYTYTLIPDQNEPERICLVQAVRDPSESCDLGVLLSELPKNY